MESTTVDAESEALHAYFREGEIRGQALGNRGPMRFGADGRLAPDIVEAYLEIGFYVFEGVISPEELGELRAGMYDMLDRLPPERDGGLDRKGRPALGADLPTSPLMWSKPLGDPHGGTDSGSFRYPVKMVEGCADGPTPEEIVYLIRGPLQFSEALLRVYGHPQLLAACASINGDDFAPFGEGLIIKKPGEGSAFAWHQDGFTHWDTKPNDPLAHGFNFMVQFFPSNPATGVWLIPGTHRQGKIDIGKMVEEAGGNLLPGAVPLVCNAGDVVMSNRQVLHCSFANGSPDWRVTLNIGFHPRSSVLDVRGRNVGDPYDAERIRQRAEMIGYAIAARQQHFADEIPYDYLPHREGGERFAWTETSRAKINGYNTLDLVI